MVLVMTMSTMELFLIFALVVVLGISALLGGVDSRDSSDWR